MSKKLAEAITLKPTDARAAVYYAIKAKQPVFLWGPPGIGKSDIIRSLAASGDIGVAKVIDLRLALMEPTDLRGFPMVTPAINGATPQMFWAAPRELPSEEQAKDYDTVILFLDELNSAPPSVQAAAYQLVLDRCIGEYRLPANAVVVAAGNRDTDKGVSFRMPTPLLNRFLHINMEHNFEDWQSWAINNNVHPDVVGYLTVAPAKLMQFDPKSVSQGFATPRSWTYVSKLLNVPGFEGCHYRLQMAQVAGAVGDGIANEFLEHRKIAGRMPAAKDILSGKVKKLDEALKHEISAKFSLTVNLAYAMNDMYQDAGSKMDDKTRPALNNMLSFAFENFQAEMVVLLLRTIYRDYMMKFHFSTDLDPEVREVLEKRYVKLIIN
jgi:hypothetical protein